MWWWCYWLFRSISFGKTWLDGCCPLGTRKVSEQSKFEKDSPCDWLIKTIKNNNTIEITLISKERIIVVVSKSTLIIIVSKSQSQNVFISGRS